MAYNGEFVELLLDLSERDHVLYMLLSACEKDITRLSLYESVIHRLTTKEAHAIIEDVEVQDVEVQDVTVTNVKVTNVNRRHEKITETEQQLDADLGKWGGSSSLPSDVEDESSEAEVEAV